MHGVGADFADDKLQVGGVVLAFVIGIGCDPFVKVTIYGTVAEGFVVHGLQVQAIEFFKLGIGKSNDSFL